MTNQNPGDAPVPEPQPKRVTEAFVEQMQTLWAPDLGGRLHVRAMIVDHAMNHRAYKKAINKQLYVRGWLRRNAQWQAECARQRPARSTATASEIIKKEQSYGT